MRSVLGLFICQEFTVAASPVQHRPCESAFAVCYAMAFPWRVWERRTTRN